MSRKRERPRQVSADEAAGCIVAFATPPGQSALAVLRISGPSAFALVDCCFEPRGGMPRAIDLAAYTMSYGYWYDQAGQALDEVVIAGFRAPHSYTGENLVEISCHGGHAPRQLVLDALLALGAQAAESGEFSRRAFLNGKLDLSQAEAVMDLIAAVSETQGKLALAQRRGAIRRQVERLSADLYSALAKLEMVLEFEDSEGSALGEEMLRELQAVQEEMETLLATFRQGRIIREGFKVVIAGRSNAGKSSLLNALLGEERAIVTDISGTTRDRLDSFIDLAGLPVQITDTAGFRQADDPVEQEGIRRAEAALEEADLILRLLNPDFSPEEMALEFLAIDQLLAAGKSVVLLLGKDDLDWPHARVMEIRERYPELVLQAFSKYDARLVGQLRDLITAQYEALATEKRADVMLSNSRQKVCLEQSLARLREGIEARLAELPLEVVASCVRAAIDQLAEISGENVSETLVEAIFSRFCVGK